MQSRTTVMAKKGIVASSHELASYWGAEVLRKGGNVVDAAITTSSMLCVVQNNLCGLGGDLFALIKCGDSKVRGVNGSGRAGKSATIDFYESQGYREIPKRGSLAALTVPGIVNAWGELVSRYGSMELGELLKPAIEYSESGFPVTQKYVDTIRATDESFGENKVWSKTFKPEGVVPRAGTTLKQKDLSSSLKSIAEEGTNTFYKGGLVEKIVDGIESAGGILEEDDFRGHSTTWDDPVKTNYRGVDIYETAPNSQGATALLWLNMVENYDLKSKNRQDLLRLFLETGLKAYEERARQIADPLFHSLPEGFTSKKYAEGVLASSIKGKYETHSTTKAGDTTYFSVADGDGNCASVIQSNYMGFGSGLMPEGTGFVLQNRGSYFTLDPKHHNSLLPGKRTFHTICASLGEKDGDTLFALGLMGGDIQPQAHVQLVTKILDFEMDIQAAIDAPRWAFPGTIYEKPSNLILEEELARSIGLFGVDGLRAQTVKGFSDQTGHAQGVIFKGGNISGGADPRGDGAVVGF